MCIRGRRLHIKKGRIAWAEAHRTREVLDCHLRLGHPESQPSTQMPRSRKVRIEPKRPIHKCSAVIKLPDDKGQRIPGPAEGKGVIFVQYHRPPSQPCSFADLVC